MFLKALPAKAVATAVVLIVGAGSATAAAAVSSGGGAPGSVTPTRSHDQGSASFDEAGDASAAPHTAAPMTSGPSQRLGNGPNVHALPGLCRAQIASAGHPNPHSVVASVNCSGVTPAGPGSSDSSPTPSASSAHGSSNGTPATAGGAPGTGGGGNGHGRR